MTNLYAATLNGADFSKCQCGLTNFAIVDLSSALGLDEVVHLGSSEIGISTLLKSGGKIPEAFLRGCGVPDSLIALIPSLIGAIDPIQFYSCFISYSSKDSDFAQRLQSRLRDEKLRVWFAPEDMKAGGDKGTGPYFKTVCEIWTRRRPNGLSLLPRESGKIGTASAQPFTILPSPL